MIEKLLNIFADIMLALSVVVIMCIVLLAAVFSLSTSSEDGFRATHQGHYKNGKREGKWSIYNEYRLDNGNDGRDKIEGFYVQGLRDGIWKFKTPYKQCVYEYDKGVVRKQICNGRYVIRRIFDERGEMQEEMIKEGKSKEECELLWNYFGYIYGAACIY
ncbi:hypothetical protein OQH61_04380 [Helicobacter sp. MIT 21-1697]|uniref:hypothetical protein n=1 Tax=Helicobacter sp. MIT 21-1697 TaxID=2993733 RepID=UPI00224B4F0D|nr:hypothetical protein [Helicobacter sp. MIT 21-1697]MCX2716969.1 hypothetical protein [Helicobacter sp. MIT 21-1697]